MLSFFAFFFVLGVLVILHEAGHFLTARFLGARADIFSVGFGKRIWGFERGGTDYRISLIPFGGYVRIPGLGPDESDVAGATEAEEEEELLPRWKRTLILFGGPITNVIAAAVFLAVAFMMGVEVPAYRTEAPVVGWVEPDSPARALGIEPGDRVLSLDGRKIETWEELENSILSSGGQQVHLTIQRDGRELSFEMTPKKITRYGLGYSGLLPPLDARVVQTIPNKPAELAGIRPGDLILGVNGEKVEQFYDLIRLISPHGGEKISIKIDRNGEILNLELIPEGGKGDGRVGISMVFPQSLERLGPGAAISMGIRECRRMTIQTFQVLGKLLRGKASIKQMSGPIDIGRIAGQAARSGLNSLIWLMGVISLQLGIFNLLPIPVLDGGHLTIIGIEAIIRRDLSMKVKERILEVGFVALMILMLVVLYNDILKILPENLYRLLTRS